MKRMVKLIIPLCIQTIPSLLTWSNKACIVGGTFPNEIHLPVQTLRLLMH